LYAESYPLGITKARMFREDLRRTGIGNGKHGFFYSEWSWPDAVELRAGVSIHAYFDAECQHELANSPLDLKQEDVNRLVWNRTLTMDLHGKDLSRKHGLLLTSKAIPSIAFVAMVKDEEDIIFVTLSWYYAIGFRKFIIIDNNSTDQTRARIHEFQRQFDDAVIIIVDDPITAHLQAEFTTGVFRLACSIWPEVRWIFPVDADEFLCIEQPLEAILAAVPTTVDALIFPKSFYMPTQDTRLTEDNTPLFETMGYRTPISPISAKVAVRAKPSYLISQGNHSISVAGGGAVTYLGGYSLGGHYREFRIRSVRHLQKKVINGGKAILAAEALGKQEIGGQHWKSWYEGYLQQGEKFFTKLFRSCFQDRNGMIFDPLPYPPPARPGDLDTE
jgi:hypothetical protein